MADKKRKEIEYINGASKSLWISVLVKSIRLGWPEGCRQAAMRLGDKISQYTALVQIFEDIYPSQEEFWGVRQEAERMDWEALCRRETNAGKFLLTPIFEEWDAVWKDRWEKEKSEFLKMAARELNLPYISPRMAANLYEWWQFKDRIPSGVYRTVDNHPWKGIPAAMADMHTPEGCQAKTYTTILSGSRRGLLWLEREVKASGWEAVREKVHNGAVIYVRYHHTQQTDLTAFL